MVRTLLVLAVVLSLGTHASAQQAREYWLLGDAQDDAGRYTLADYVDAASISAQTPNTRRAWTWIFNAPHSTAELAGTHVVAFGEYNCSARQRRDLQWTRYSTEGHVLSASSQAGLWHYVTPGTFGEGELDFVCSSPASWPRIATRVDARMTPREHAAALFASR